MFQLKYLNDYKNRCDNRIMLIRKNKGSEKKKCGTCYKGETSK